MGFELEDIAKKLDNSNQSGFEMERIATALGGTGNGFELEKIRDGVMNGSGGSGENIEYYKAVIRGDVTYFEGDVESVRDNAFTGCASLASVNLPAATTIRIGAFTQCSSLTSVNLPVATEIGNGAFGGCTSLISVNLPAATTIGSFAFVDCSSLEEVYLGYSSVVQLGSSAFTGCTSLSAIIVPQSLYSAYLAASQWTSYSGYLQYEADDSGTK